MHCADGSAAGQPFCKLMHCAACYDCCRLRVEVERLESELSRQKPVMKELDKAAAAARAASRQSADQAVLLDKQLRQLRQQHQEELAAATAELNKARHAARWVAAHIWGQEPALQFIDVACQPRLLQSLPRQRLSTCVVLLCVLLIMCDVVVA